jgi:hypothetical protein
MLYLHLETGYPRDTTRLGEHINVLHLHDLIQRFLYNQLHPNAALSSNEVPLHCCPFFVGKISVYHSATATFYMPSDLAGKGGMQRKQIRATPKWWRGHARYDPVFLNMDAALPGLQGLQVVRLRLLFSFSHAGILYPCALVH